MSARANKSPDWHPELDIDKIHMLDACREGRVDKVCEFLNGTNNRSPAVDVDEGDDDGTTALQIAAARGNLNLVKTLIRSYDAKVDLANELGFTPFLHACREGHLEVATCLKESGANETLKTKFGVSALGLAAAGGHSKIINFLMSLNLDINSKEMNLTPTPLMAAAARSQIDAAICLESRGAKIDYVSPTYGLTALHVALLSGSADMLDTLIELGGRIDQIKLCGKNAGTIADTAGNLEALHFLNQLEKQQLNGIQRPRLQRTQIASIIERSDPAELQQLKLREPRECHSSGITPLMYSVLLNRPKTVDFLLQNNEGYLSYDAEVNAQEPEFGLSALMMAIIVGDMEMIERLLEAGADPHLEFQLRKDGDVFTSFDLALFSGFSDALRLLFLYEYADTHVKHTKEAKNHQRSAPKELINRFLHRFGLGETETVGEPPKNRDHFNLLLNSAHLDFSQPIPFMTADELLLSGQKPPSTCHPPTADDRLELVKNLAKITIEKEGFLKPFPVGIPQNGNFSRVETFLVSACFQPPSKQNEYASCQSSAEQNYQELKQKNGIRSRTNSNVSRNNPIAYTYSNAPNLHFLPNPNNMNGVEYADIPRPFNPRSVPSRRLSENAHTQNRLSMYAQNDKHWSSSEASAGQHTRNASMLIEPREPPSYGSRTQSPLLQQSRTPSSRHGRPKSLYTSSTSSVPNSPANSTIVGQQRRFITASNKMHTPTQSPKVSNSQALRHRVRPDGHGIRRFDSQNSSTSAPSTPPNNSLFIPQIQMPKSLPSTQKYLPILTMNEIEQRLKRLQLGSYFNHFVQQEIDPTVFLQLSLADFQKLIQNERVAEKIWTLAKQLREEFGGTLTESL